jgi:hypothetical protein
LLLLQPNAADFNHASGIAPQYLRERGNLHDQPCFDAIAPEDLILGVAFFIWWKPLLDLFGMVQPSAINLGMKLVYIFIAANCIFLRQFPCAFISLAIIDVLILYFLIRYLRQLVPTLQAG